jgi:hypothetical protein
VAAFITLIPATTMIAISVTAHKMDICFFFFLGGGGRGAGAGVCGPAARPSWLRDILGDRHPHAPAEGKKRLGMLTNHW